jgi:hypothetical protein
VIRPGIRSKEVSLASQLDFFPEDGHVLRRNYAELDPVRSGLENLYFNAVTYSDDDCFSHLAPDYQHAASCCA